MAKPVSKPYPVRQLLRQHVPMLSFWLSVCAWSGLELTRAYMERRADWVFMLWSWGVVLGFLGMLWISLRAGTTHYEMDKVSIRIRKGIFTRVTDAVDMEKIEHVRLKRTFWDQLVGLARLEIRSKDLELPILRMNGLKLAWARQAFAYINTQSTDRYDEYIKRQD